MDRGTINKPDNGPMRFSFSWPLLGLVIERSSYGYELISRFERIYGEILRVTADRRVYDALEELEDRGLIEQVRGAETPDHAPRRPRVHYRATEQGRLAYQEWLVAEINQERERARLFARQLTMLEPQAALEVLDRYERECLEESAIVEATEPGAEGGVSGGLVERLTHEDERLALGVKLSWFEYARRQLHSRMRSLSTRQADQSS